METLRKQEQEPTPGVLADLERVMREAAASLSPEEVALLTRMDAEAELSKKHPEAPQDLETLLSKTPEVDTPRADSKKSQYNPQTQFQAYGPLPTS